MPYLGKDDFKHRGERYSRFQSRRRPVDDGSCLNRGGVSKTHFKPMLLKPICGLEGQIRGASWGFSRICSLALRIKYLKHFDHKLIGSQTSFEIIDRLRFRSRGGPGDGIHVECVADPGRADGDSTLWRFGSLDQGR